MYTDKYFSAIGKALTQLKNRVELELEMAKKRTGNGYMVSQMEDNLHALSNLIATTPGLASFARPLDDTFTLIESGCEVIRVRVDYWNGNDWQDHSSAIYDRREDTSQTIPGLEPLPEKAH